MWAFAKLIADLENLDGKTLFILETAAITHDIGIRPSLEKYGSGRGDYQEIEGPPVARELLQGLNYEQAVIDRVCYLIGHHHTYDSIDGLDYQILVEADFLVNIYENEMGPQAVRNIRRTIFATAGGKQIFDQLYGQ